MFSSFFDVHKHHVTCWPEKSMRFIATLLDQHQLENSYAPQNHIAFTLAQRDGTPRVHATAKVPVPPKVLRPAFFLVRF